MAKDINLFVSNGTCYMGPYHQADKAMIPCGNDANDHVACCQAGDNCLESSVCYNSEFGVTYIAGCSDGQYEHRSCPHKFLFLTTPWLGLSYCNGTSNQWVMCDQEKKPATLGKADTCYCPKDEDDRPFRLSQKSVIPGTASLPQSVLGSIQFSVGYYPTLNPEPPITTATEASSGTVEPISGASSSPSAPTVPANLPPNLSHETGLSPGSNIGAIVGGAVGGLLIALLIAALVCFRRRQHKRQVQMQEEALRVDEFMHGETKSGAASEPDPVNLGIAAPSTASSPDTPALSELDSRAARPWSLRSELGDSSATRSSYNTAGGCGGHGSTGQPRRAPSELASRPIAELPG